MASVWVIEDRMIAWGSAHPWVGYLLVFGIVVWAAARMLQEWDKRKHG